MLQNDTKRQPVCCPYLEQNLESLKSSEVNCGDGSTSSSSQLDCPPAPAGLVLQEQGGSTSTLNALGWSTSQAGEESLLQQGVLPTAMLLPKMVHLGPLFGGTFPSVQQMGLAQQHRRSPLGHHPHQGTNTTSSASQRNSYSLQQQQQTFRALNWGSHQQPTGGGSGGWGSVSNNCGRGLRRSTGVMGISNSIPSCSSKRSYSSHMMVPPKLNRGRPAFASKPWMEENPLRTDGNSNWLPHHQEWTHPYDTFNMHSLENSLIDILQNEQEPLKGRSALFPVEDGFLDNSQGDQSLSSGLNSPALSQNGKSGERYSRKVFVGGLPPDIDEDEIIATFCCFGQLMVDWPHKSGSKSYFPPKGYAFLLFQEECSVQVLIDACFQDDGKLYLCVSSRTVKDKPVQIRPWSLSDSDFVLDGSQPLDPRKTVFVGGVPRPLKAVELAMIMDQLYGGVCYAGIDTDPELKYPKGAGRVAFANQQSYIAAISARFIQLQHRDIDKRVEVKPYVLVDQLCDECQGAHCNGKFAPFFCANITCLQYYCDYCWTSIHSQAGREYHKPLVKEGGERLRQLPFHWS
ncbi:cytoplasmic polyadenylation element-binding protein 2-like [Chiloscyllium plagiosum]|uniref:cytoplasmic polyadenylation element-binding protein 2-like n=1 Tax=Chiloscyllium plagiosum TaxID=36176 RepID=UPI001CB7C71B|nr:cytoplasmic polyadenylation element-binding protein 2-like [Chiloscyllium plagiosum]XP_043537209.1 cytoplasmic polyadenylation element-binding protein 2-like [Chiloscyllium plagiosum]